MRPKKSNALPKYVFAKQKTLQHPKGVLYFERRGWPSVKFKTQDPTAPEFWVEYAAFMSDGYRPAAKTSGGAYARKGKEKRPATVSKGRCTFSFVILEFL